MAWLPSELQEQLVTAKLALAQSEQRRFELESDLKHTKHELQTALAEAQSATKRWYRRTQAEHAGMPGKPARTGTPEPYPTSPKMSEPASSSGSTPLISDALAAADAKEASQSMRSLAGSKPSAAMRRLHCDLSAKLFVQQADALSAAAAASGPVHALFRPAVLAHVAAFLQPMQVLATWPKVCKAWCALPWSPQRELWQAWALAGSMPPALRCRLWLWMSGDDWAALVQETSPACVQSQRQVRVTHTLGLGAPRQQTATVACSARSRSGAALTVTRKLVSNGRGATRLPHAPPAFTTQPAAGVHTSAAAAGLPHAAHMYSLVLSIACASIEAARTRLQAAEHSVRAAEHEQQAHTLLAKALSMSDAEVAARAMRQPGVPVTPVAEVAQAQSSESVSTSAGSPVSAAVAARLAQAAQTGSRAIEDAASEAGDGESGTDSGDDDAPAASGPMARKRPNLAKRIGKRVSKIVASTDRLVKNRTRARTMSNASTSSTRSAAEGKAPRSKLGPDGQRTALGPHCLGPVEAASFEHAVLAAEEQFNLAAELGGRADSCDADALAASVQLRGIINTHGLRSSEHDPIALDVVVWNGVPVRLHAPDAPTLPSKSPAFSPRSAALISSPGSASPSGSTPPAERPGGASPSHRRSSSAPLTPAPPVSAMSALDTSPEAHPVPPNDSWLALASQVDADVARSFTGYDPLWVPLLRSSLRKVLLATAVMDPGVGYCQGMHCMAGLALATALNAPLPLGLRSDGSRVPAPSLSSAPDSCSPASLVALTPGSEGTTLASVMHAATGVQESICTPREIDSPGSPHAVARAEEFAWTIMQVLLRRHGLISCLAPGLPGLGPAFHTHSRVLRHVRPSLQRMLTNCNISPDLYATSWFMTAFSSPANLPQPWAAAVWDMVALCGTPWLHRVAVALLYHAIDAGPLLSGDFNAAVRFLMRDLRDDLTQQAERNPHAFSRFMQRAAGMALPAGMIQVLHTQFHELVGAEPCIPAAELSAEQAEAFAGAAARIDTARTPLKLHGVHSRTASAASAL